jgi:hypothetical protein
MMMRSIIIVENQVSQNAIIPTPKGQKNMSFNALSLFLESEEKVIMEFLILLKVNIRVKDNLQIIIKQLFLNLVQKQESFSLLFEI